MAPGALTGYVDVAQIVFYAFLLFFFSLVSRFAARTDARATPSRTRSRGQQGPDPVLIPSPKVPPPDGKTTSAAGGARPQRSRRHRPQARALARRAAEPTDTTLHAAVGPGPG